MGACGTGSIPPDLATVRRTVPRARGTADRSNYFGRAGRDPELEHVLLVPSNELREHLLKRLASVPGVASVFAGASVMTLYDFAVRLLKHRGIFPAELPPARMAAAILAAVRETYASGGGDFGGISATPGFIPALARTLSDLEEGCVGDAELALAERAAKDRGDVRKAARWAEWRRLRASAGRKVRAMGGRRDAGSSGRRWRGSISPATRSARPCTAFTISPGSSGCWSSGSSLPACWTMSTFPVSSTARGISVLRSCTPPGRGIVCAPLSRETWSSWPTPLPPGSRRCASGSSPPRRPRKRARAVRRPLRSPRGRGDAARRPPGPVLARRLSRGFRLSSSRGR